MDFLTRYKKLNTGQREAVDLIDGPLMVIAGPGTGKTELLSVRVANILQKTDTLPESILCLTFTESGAEAMRQRLTEIIGKDAYKVSIHTFHSFGSEVINQNSEFFYKNTDFRAADELSSYELMRDIFDKLSHSNILSGKQNGEYVYLKDSQTAISELKKSGLTSDELLAILDENDMAIEKAEVILAPIFAEKISKNTASKLSEAAQQIRLSGDMPPISTVVPLSQVIADSITIAINDADVQKSTKPITAWKNTWLKKDDAGKIILKSKQRQEKLRALSFVYSQYLTMMHEASLYDFDDMILRVVHAIEIFSELRFNLQEKYQYIMVDEFQDTNMAQMRILHNLASSEAQGDTPNIMVVGDDDQAIYSFQGADVSNILDFKHNYPKAKIVTLTENYRSHSSILSGSREIIIQGRNRLENILDDINKQLNSNNNLSGKTQIFEAESTSQERQWLIRSIQEQIKNGVKPIDIAVLTRKHQEIASLLPYFSESGIAVNYERRDNILELDIIRQIDTISRIIINLSVGNHGVVNAALPEILSHPMWQIEPRVIWQLSLQAYKNHEHWLEVMSSSPKLALIYKWFIDTASMSSHLPLEQMLDVIVGIKTDTAVNSEFESPIYDYYFSKDKMADSPESYLQYLEAIRTIRSKLKEYQPDKSHNLKSFINYIDLCNKTKSVISSSRLAAQNENAVCVMTAHKSKGLEFETVYITNAVDTIWGEKARKHNRLISYPENLPLAPVGENEDERLRLFYVATTRAKKHLFISYSLNDDNNHSTVKAAFLVNNNWKVERVELDNNQESLIKAQETAWYGRLVEPISSNMNDLLKPTMTNYKLSVTHLHNFLDVSKGGPATFLLQNLLRFPKAKSASAAFGTAIHETLRHAHSHYSAEHEKRAVEDIVSYFEALLKKEQLDANDYSNYLQKGGDVLRNFFEKMYESFSIDQRAELDFAHQGSVIGEAKLTGKLDLTDIDKTQRTISYTDYKTGKPQSSWLGKTDYEKIKLHKYRQQLMFYELMLKNSKDYRKFDITNKVIQFVEPNRLGEVLALNGDYSDSELQKFEKLIQAVWQHIINLDLPDTSLYEPNLKGILKFEDDLVDNHI